VDAVVGEDGVEENVACVTVEGDGGEVGGLTGAEAVDDAGGVGSGDGVGSCAGEVEATVVGVEEGTGLPGVGVDAVAEGGSEPVEEVEVEIGGVSFAGVEVFDGAGDEVEEGFVGAFVAEEAGEDFAPEEDDVHFHDVKVEGRELDEGGGGLEFVKPALGVFEVFHLGDLEEVRFSA